MTIEELLTEQLSGELGQTVAQLERQRLSTRRRTCNVMLCLIVITVVVILVLRSKGMGTFPCLLAVLVATIIGLILKGRSTSHLVADFKDQVIPQLLTAVFPEVSYGRNDWVEEHQFTASGLFRAPDRYSGKDSFVGLWGATRFCCSLVHAEERYETTTTDTDIDGNTTTRNEEHWRDIFQGLFFTADFNKYLHSQTLVRDGKAGLFARLSSTLVKLEDPLFNRQFRVYSGDQVEARYILTPRMMERLLDLQERFEHCDISFTGSWVHIALAGVPYDISCSCTDQRQLDNLCRWILATVGIIDTLDLNTRIWTKE